MYCYNCALPIEPNSLFCANCGSKQRFNENQVAEKNNITQASRSQVNNFNDLLKNKNKLLGFVLIVSGLLSIFIFPAILHLFNLYNLYFVVMEYNIRYLIGIIISGYGLNFLFNKNLNNVDDALDSTDLSIGERTITQQDNKIMKISLTGGLIGLFLGKPHDLLNDRIKKENSQGWEVVQILPDTNVNLLTIILRLALLVFTLLLYTKANGYYIVFKK